jgi:GAF domain-containing protein
VSQHEVVAGGAARWAVELQALLLSTEGVDEFLHEVAVAAVRALPSAAACGVTLEPNGRARTVAASSELANQVDEVQYEADQGPCLDAMNAGETIYVPDLVDEERWPQFTSAALSYGIRSILSTPLRGLDSSVGALNLYATSVNAFDNQSRAHAAGFAEYAAGAVGLALRMTHHLQLSVDLQAALSSREIIDQAIGIIMAQQRCTAREAFAVLRQASQHRNVKIAAIAAGIVEAVSGQPPLQGRFTARG